MTLKQLSRAVAALGFEREIGDPDALRASASRALGIIFTDRPVLGRIRLDVTSPEPVLGIGEIRHKGGESESFPLEGRAYSFRLSGRGRYTVYDGDNSTTREFSSPSQVVNGRLKVGGRVVFSGEYPYTVRGLACYLADFPEDSDPPELGRMRELDVGALCRDLLTFVSPPTDGRGDPITGALLSEGILSLPFTYSGEVHLTYRMSAPPIDCLSPDAAIDLPPDTEPLLPILTAAFLWLEDEPERAEYYMSLYKEESALLRRYATRAIDNTYRHNGWA